MPTREYKRTWCLKCSDWKLHNQQYPNWKDWFCKDCETGHQEFDLSIIPEKKILEQRERYKDKERKDMEEVLDSIRYWLVI